MKKFTLFSMAAMLLLSGQAPAQDKTDYPPSASTEVFDFTPWKESTILELFVKAMNEGRNYPSAEEWTEAGFNLDLEFSRSHVRPRDIIEDASKNVVPEVYAKRRLWMNMPTGQGDLVGGYPSSLFNNDTFSMWNYVNLYGAWNHSPFQAPGSWADAAHKNGTDMFSGIKFFDTTGGRGQTATEYINLISTKNPDGSFRYVDAFINVLKFFGLDGINYNWEDTGYNNKTVIAFHQALYKRAAELNFDSFHIGLYGGPSYLTNPADYFANENGRTTEVMMNYSANDIPRTLAMSQKNAIAIQGDCEGLYQGVWIASMDRQWTNFHADGAEQVGLCLWGEHKISRFFQFAIGDNTMELQSNYQKLLEKGFSGGKRSPIDRPALSNSGNIFEISNNDDKPNQMVNFAGFADFVPERTAIQGDLPFTTHFSLGNGERYNYKGKKTFGSWYNMGQQDIVPTYRWLIYDANTKTRSTAVDAEFTHEDAYTGGSALRLSGEPTAKGSDVVLYRAKLNVSGGNAKANVALKSGVNGTNASNLYVILKKFNDDTWMEFPVGNLNGPTWEEKEIALSGINSGDIIEYIGFRVKGTYEGNYNMLIGKLALTDDCAVKTPAPIDAESIIVEVKEETTQSLSVKLNWAVNATGYNSDNAKYGLIYNDEVNIDHFQLMYKNGENGKVSEIGRTSTWSAYLGNIMFETATDDPYIGIRSVSVDGKTYSPVEWIHIGRGNASELPAFNNDPYCESTLNYNAEGADIAIEVRYIEQFKTTGAVEDINYTADAPQADGTQYAMCDQTLKVNQGQEVELFFKAADLDDGLKFCLGKAYIDLDGSKSHEPATETIFELGTVKQGTPEFQTTGVTQKFTIPADAKPGESRLRLVFSDAWFAHPGPCGFTAKGFTLDIPVEIIGNNPSREPAPDMHDQGEADEPEGLNNNPDGVENVWKDSESVISTMWPTTTEGTIYFNNVEKAWIYTTDGQLVKYVPNNPSSTDISDITPAIYVVKMQKGNIVRSQKLIKK